MLILFVGTQLCGAAYAPLAQLAEQLTLNQWVPGSSPGGCTQNKGSSGYRPLENDPGRKILAKLRCIRARLMALDMTIAWGLTHMSARSQRHWGDPSVWTVPAAGSDGGLSVAGRINRIEHESLVEGAPAKSRLTGQPRFLFWSGFPVVLHLSVFTRDVLSLRCCQLPEAHFLYKTLPVHVCHRHSLLRRN
jgi:hypothetical protein